MPTNQEKPTSQKPPNEYMRYANMGFQMVVIIGLGVWCGIKLDKVTQLKFPVFSIVLSLLAVVIAIYFVIRDLLKK